MLPGGVLLSQVEPLTEGPVVTQPDTSHSIPMCCGTIEGLAATSFAGGLNDSMRDNNLAGELRHLVSSGLFSS